MYQTLHEADLQKFVETMDNLIQKQKQHRQTNLKKFRTLQGISQKQLATLSGVSLRMIQLYEQKRSDINKAQSLSLLNISKILGCTIEDLLED